jgi:hypothetical protein
VFFSCNSENNEKSLNTPSVKKHTIDSLSSCEKAYNKCRDTSFTLLSNRFNVSKKLLSDYEIIFSEDNGIGKHHWLSSDANNAFKITSFFHYSKDNFPLLSQKELKINAKYIGVDTLFLINPNCPLFMNKSGKYSIPDSIISISFTRETNFFCESPEIGLLGYWDYCYDVEVRSKSGYTYKYYFPKNGNPPELTEKYPSK